MFDTRVTGKKIMELRKQKNLTQMELADHMGVSYQAVSNWERGNSMPDISKLPELAELFDCSVDYLLGNSKETQLIKQVIKGEDINLEEEDVLGTVASAAPIMRPEQTENIVDKVIESNDHIDIESIIAIAPFVGSDYLDKLLEKVDAVKDIKLVVSLAPFLSTKTINKLVNRLENAGGLKEVSKLAPFMKQEDIDALVMKAVKQTDGEPVKSKNIIRLAPFVSSECLNDIINQLDVKMDIKTVTALAPFLKKGKVDKVVLDNLEGSSPKDFVSLYPFMEAETLREIANKLLQAGDGKAIQNIAPFL